MRTARVAASQVKTARSATAIAFGASPCVAGGHVIPSRRDLFPRVHAWWEGWVQMTQLPLPPSHESLSCMYATFDCGVARQTQRTQHSAGPSRRCIRDAWHDVAVGIGYPAVHQRPNVIQVIACVGGRSSSGHACRGDAGYWCSEILSGGRPLYGCAAWLDKAANASQVPGGHTPRVVLRLCV